MTYTIEAGIPIPKHGRGRNPGPECATMLKLTVGESFVVPADRAKTAQKVLGNLNRRHDRRFISYPEGTDGARRFWRVS